MVGNWQNWLFKMLVKNDSSQTLRRFNLKSRIGGIPLARNFEPGTWN
jgi:hypothetical protein